MKTIDRHQAHIKEVIRAHRAWYGLRTEDNPRPRSIGGFTKNQLDDLPGKRAKHFYMGGMKLYPIMGASPGTFYIDPVNGNDANAGDSANPWKTLQKGNDGAVAGDTINLGGQGNYTEDNQVVGEGARLLLASKQLTWQPWSGTGTPTIDFLKTDDGTGWSLESGSIYKKTYQGQDRVQVVYEDGARLTRYAVPGFSHTTANMTEGSFLHKGDLLYIWANGSGSPGTNGKTYTHSFTSGIRFGTGAANSIWDGITGEHNHYNPTGTYTVDQLKGSFLIEADGMTMKNCTVRYSPTRGTGLVRTSSDVSLKDVTIDNVLVEKAVDDAFHFHGTTGMVLQNSEVKDLGFYYSQNYHANTGSWSAIVNTGTIQDTDFHDIGGFGGSSKQNGIAVEQLSDGGVACVIQRCKVFNSNYGINLARMDGGDILYCLSYDNDGDGIRGRSRTTGQIGDAPINWEVYHCVLWANARRGIRLDDSLSGVGGDGRVKGWNIKNNIIGENAERHLTIDDGANTLDYNCYHAGSGVNEWKFDGTTYTSFTSYQAAQDANGIDADPLFVDETGRDFHLVS